MLRARPSSPGGARALARPSGPSQRGLSPPRRPHTAPASTLVQPSVPSSSSSRAVLAVAASPAARAPSSPEATLSAHPDAVRRRQRLEAQRAELEAQRSTPWYELPAPGNVRAARTVADLEAAVAGTFPPPPPPSPSPTSSAPPPRLTVLEFYVPACPACRSLAPKLRQLAADNPDVDFVTVNGEASAEMSAAVESLGVNRLPYFAVYRSSGSGTGGGERERVSAFACNLRRVAVLRAEIAAAKACVGECAAAEWGS